MGKFLKTSSLSKPNQKEAENLNRLKTTNEIEAVIKNLPTHKSPGPDSFTGKCYQPFKEELTPILLFQKKSGTGKTFKLFL